MKIKLFFILIIISSLFSGCGLGSIPQEKSTYIGVWQGKLNNESMYLVIRADASLSYKRQSNDEGMSHSTSINAPIQEFKEDNFIAGILTWDTKFVVTQAPKEINGTWTMTVDCIKLVKQPNNTIILTEEQQKP